jgi:hypothetical protein
VPHHTKPTRPHTQLAYSVNSRSLSTLPAPTRTASCVPRTVSVTTLNLLGFPAFCRQSIEPAAQFVRDDRGGPEYRSDQSDNARVRRASRNEIQYDYDVPRASRNQRIREARPRVNRVFARRRCCRL